MESWNLRDLETRMKDIKRAQKLTGATCLHLFKKSVFECQKHKIPGNAVHSNHQNFLGVV